MKYRTLFFSVFFLITARIASGQEIQLTLEITKDILSTSQRDYLEDFENKVRNYVNDHRWTNVDFAGDKIPVTFSINFLSGTDGGEFTAQVVVASNRRTYVDGRPTQASSLVLRIMDPKWSFTYIKGQPFYHDEFQFNDITSFIDFYIYLAIGLDFDSMEPLQGTSYYQKAMNIAQRSQSSGRSAEWQGSTNQFSRINFLSELQNAVFDNFRTALYWYYYEGIDFMTTDKDMAQRAVARALENIMDVLARGGTRSLLLSMWLEIKSPEFCTLLDGYPQRVQLMNNMIQIDPVRAETYRRCNF